MYNKKIGLLLILLSAGGFMGVKGQELAAPATGRAVFLRSAAGHHGGYNWEMEKADKVGDGGEVSAVSYKSAGWQPAIVPGTVLNSLVGNKVYPEPYFGDNNRLTRKLIPDIADAGKEFYHYWFRTKFTVPVACKGKRVWLKLHGINYRSAVWLNGKKLGDMAGMFNTHDYDITAIANRTGNNVLAVDVQPLDIPGVYYKFGQGGKTQPGEGHNGGDRNIGKNVAMLQTIGWDFTIPDGVRDRNTGIWRDIELFATGDVTLQSAYVQTRLALPDTTKSWQTISVEATNATDKVQKGILAGRIVENNVSFQQTVTLNPHETRVIAFTPAAYKQLMINHPKLWWPLNKGNQNLYTLSLKFTAANKQISQAISTRFGIREITSDQQTPDKSRRFYVNGQPVFIRGSNWVPEAMLRTTAARTYAELRYTKQAGINFLRLWGGGITESDYFYQVCDELGIMVWSEFWLTADTRGPIDTALYFKNITSTIKRIRPHASIAYYVGANEGAEVKGTGVLIKTLDPNTGYQVQSECCGVHDGSPYKYENPMQYFQNTASARGSRVDGFNPEYGTPALPTIESLRKMMPARDLWPITDSVWNYLDGNGFHQINTKYREAVNAFGQSSSIEEYAKKAQFVSALSFRALWEVWNYNKFNFGDRWASGVLFWYHNSTNPQTSSRFYDYFLTPTAALYYTQNALAPLHPQFDYLKNTVSVYNDYRVAFNDYNVEATVYDINLKQISTQSSPVNIPADGTVKDALKLTFAEDISPVHFIKLKLKDAKGTIVGDAFYWRSKNVYKGPWTMTGPTTAGFEEISKLAKAGLTVVVNKNELVSKSLLKITVRNPSKGLAFFTELKLLDTKGDIILPVYYSDNFFSLLPGESKTITAEVPARYKTEKLKLVTGAFNAPEIMMEVKNQPK